MHLTRLSVAGILCSNNVFPYLPLIMVSVYVSNSSIILQSAEENVRSILILLVNCKHCRLHG